MATSDSDDFESADEELVARDTPSRKLTNQWQSPSSAIDSESDDDNECMPSVNSSASRNVQSSGQERIRSRSSVASVESTHGQTPSAKPSASSEQAKDAPKASSRIDKREGSKNTSAPPETGKDGSIGRLIGKSIDFSQVAASVKRDDGKDESAVEAKTEDAARKLSFSTDETAESSETKQKVAEKSEAAQTRKERAPRQRRAKESKSLGAKKLGSRVVDDGPARPPSVDADTPEEIRRRAIAEGKEPPIIEECWEFNEEETAKILKGMKDFGLGDGDRVRMPEELKSDKKFSEVFKPDGWEGLDDEEILAELDENGVRPVLDKIASASEERSNYSGWGSWGSWGVNSLINSATASVTTLAEHVTHGLTLLDEAVGAPNPAELARPEQKPNDDEVSIGKKFVV